MATETTSSEQDFLARMSHELRTPLNAIQGYAEMLLEDKTEHHDDAPDLRSILRATRRLQAFVDAVLDLNQLHMGKFQLKPQRFQVADLATEVELAIHDLALKHHTKVLLDVTPIEAHTDRRMVRQILFNLADNAVRFTVRGMVSIRIRPNPDATFEIRVADTGIGMTRAQIEASTQAFWQAEMGTTRRYDGAGMGLAVCNGLAEAMGGSLTIESRFGKGARVTVVLPIESSTIDEWDDIDELTVLLR